MKAYIVNEVLSAEIFSILEEKLKGKYLVCRSYNASIDGLDTSCDIAVVVYPVAHEEIDSVKQKVHFCYQKALKVVAFYTDNDMEKIPGEIEMGGFSSITIESQEIESFLEGNVVWEQPDGNKSKYNDIGRNKCIKIKRR